VAYDGNGNVMGLVDAADGSVVAEYDYDPWGDNVSELDTSLLGNPIGYSCRYLDDETGLVYYGFRYYNMANATWLNRDPYGEKGGINLFAFLNNCSLISVDRLGLSLLIPKRAPTRYLADYNAAEAVVDWIWDTSAIVDSAGHLTVDGHLITRITFYKGNNTSTPDWNTAIPTYPGIWVPTRTVNDHEMEHVRKFEKWWNRFRPLGNRFEGQYDICCAQEMQNLFNNMSEWHRLNAYAENLRYDLSEYGWTPHLNSYGERLDASHSKTLEQIRKLESDAMIIRGRLRTLSCTKIP
jgi:RHS repeat-associated protein